MKKNLLILASISVVAVAVLFTAPTAFAQETNQTPTTTEKTPAERRAEITERIERLKAERKTRLSEARQRTCETRVEKINSIIQKRGEQAQKHLETFKRIATRVQEFVQTKQRTVENYDSLVATIAEREAAAQAAIDTNNETTFDCTAADGSDPAKLPRATITTVRDTLKEYRTAIKDLIVQVKNSSEGREQ